MTLTGPFALPLTPRGYDSDVTGTIPLPLVFRYFEHARWQCISDARLGLIDLIHDGHFFVVHKQTVEVLRRIGPWSDLTLFTHFLSAGRSSAAVGHELVRKRDGALIARARVQGAWLGPNRRLARLPQVFRDFAAAQIDELRGGKHIHTHDPTPPPTGHARSFFAPPEVVHPGLGIDADAPSLEPLPAVFTHEVVVPERDLDMFSHVNAATWVRYINDARRAAARADKLPHAQGAGGFNVRTAIHYRHEAVAGDRLQIALAPLPSGALGAWITRDASPEVLCCAAVDTEPGFTPISPPRRRPS